MNCYAKAIKDSIGYNSITNARLRLSSPLHKTVLFITQNSIVSRVKKMLYLLKETVLYLPLLCGPKCVRHFI